MDFPITAAVSSRCRKVSADCRWLPDTIYAAAWALLQARWTGNTALDIYESFPSQGLPQFPSGSHLVKIDEGMGTAYWLAAFDHGRRGAQDVFASSAETVWAQAAPGPDDVSTHFLTLWHDIGGASGEYLHLETATGRIDAAAGFHLLACIADAAEQMLENPGDPISAIRALPQTDQALQLDIWNELPGNIDPTATVHGHFRNMAVLHAGKVAIEHGNEKIRYDELDSRSDLLAGVLAARGVRPGAYVGLLLDRSIDAIVAMLAILKAGAIYVPVSPDYPAERIRQILAQTGTAHVIGQPNHRYLMPDGCRLFLVDECEPHGMPGVTSPAVLADGLDLAYVMYTSGSTGLPKGIEICHQSILRLVVGARYIDLLPGAGLLHAAPLAFDASTLEIWGALLTGGRCVVHSESLPTSRQLAQTITRHGVETAWLTASLFNALVDEDVTCLFGLTQLLIGGEALSMRHVRRALAALPHLAISNGYGPTECTTFAAVHRIESPMPPDMRSVPLGRPITETVLRILSPSSGLMPTGWVGELFIGGRGLARGYLNAPELTTRRFIPDPLGAPGQRLYRTGDLARWRPDGTIEFIGRIDTQVKIRGHRIELTEVEVAVMSHPAIKACAVIARVDGNGRMRMIVYLVAHAGEKSWPAIRQYLLARLPMAMLPTSHVWLERLPMTANGKLDKSALPDPARQRPEQTNPYQEARGDLEEKICVAFGHALDMDGVGRNDNFFDLGGDSLRVLEVIAELQGKYGVRLETNIFFRLPTPAGIVENLDASKVSWLPVSQKTQNPVGAAEVDEPIAVIAMAGRFPGANSVEKFWENLLAGNDSISFFDETTLDTSITEDVRAQPAYIKARGIIEGIENFDAAFFGINPAEARLMDPQQRVFLEICWECMERAGYVPDDAPGPVGVFGGMHNATYFQRHVLPRPDLVEAVGAFQVMLANEKDYLATRVAHRLNLTGPAVSLNTACSTSLVAVAQAFHALKSGQCRMALAGGVSITCPPRSGYLYEEGSMLSPDGHTRSFSSDAQGTVFSDGAAVVLLKRLSDAVADGDLVYAVLRSAAVNNDGGSKASFTAPSVTGQAAVIGAALQAAGIDARSISYVEAHGTATPLGDPVEVEALGIAFGMHTSDRGFCTLGSLKSNVGHMVTAAGASGLIKTALALHHQRLPGTVHFKAPHPAIDFAKTPFLVSAQTRDWARTDVVRRAGVSSFGVGGTNAHVILQEAPAAAGPDQPADDFRSLLVLSARSGTALATAAGELAGFLEGAEGAHAALADVAHTLVVGRKTHGHRMAVVAGSVAEAAAALRNEQSPWRATARIAAAAPRSVWMFPGQGSQYAGMGKELYAADAVFRDAFDACLSPLGGVLDFDLRERMFAPDATALDATSVTQPATFILEYALATRLLALGLQPDGFIGHSVGEFVAAVLAGVMTLPDAALLVARRGALMQAMPTGAMLSVRLSVTDVEPWLSPRLCLAAENGPRNCVVAGSHDDVDQLQRALLAAGTDSRRLQTSHAFHSAMMDPAVPAFEALVRRVALKPPVLPLFSTLSGSLLDAAQATDPAYWARHLRETVRFSAAVQSATSHFAAPVFVELGPRNTLATLVGQHRVAGSPAIGIPMLADQPHLESQAFALGAGKLWSLGAEIDLSGLDPRKRKARVRLPTYPFERVRCWVEPESSAPSIGHAVPTTSNTARPAAHQPPSPSESSMTAMLPTSDLLRPAVSQSGQAIDLRLRQLFEEISGADMSLAPGNAQFSELGMDSLTLTQAATRIKKHFKITLSFRQLMENFRSFDSLAAHIATQLPAPVAMAAEPVALHIVRPEAAAPDDANVGSTVHRLLMLQAQLMPSLLEMLRPSAVAAPAAMLPAALSLQSVSPPIEEARAPTGIPLAYDVNKAFGAIARIHKQTRTLTDRQSVRLATFMRRYIERTVRSKAFTAKNRPHMADPRVVNGFRPSTKEITYQIVVDRSAGSHLWDIDGNEYVDVLCGFGMNMFGWQPPFVTEAVRRQLDDGYEIGPQHPLSADVTALICELTGFERAALCNTGSEAVMGALRIARTVTGRNTVVAFTGSYHGTFDEVLVRAGRGGKGIPAAPGVMSGVFDDIRVLEYGSPEALDFIRANADDLAAVLVEPVQSRRPDYVPREFLVALREITEASGTCLIFDEVITGFRCSLGGAQELLGIRADLATYGKVIGGGFPVGVIAGHRSFMDALDGGAWEYGDNSAPSVGVTYFAGTFVRHPLALAAAKASLLHLRAEGPELQRAMNRKTLEMAERMNVFCRAVGAPLEIRHFASLWRTHWLEEHVLQDLLFAMMRSRGVHILDNFPCFLTTAHSAEDIAAIETAFRDSVSEMQESGFLPRRPAAGNRAGLVSLESSSQHEQLQTAEGQS